MNRLLRPWLLLAVALALLLAAAGYLLYPRSPLLQPMPVAAGEQEIAWLYPATAPANWNRFIMALARVADHLQDTFPGLVARIDARTFPVESAAIPEAALEWPDGHRLIFRWYKTTSEQDAAHWLGALIARKPAPLAILGGNTSDAAYRSLVALAKRATTLPLANRPLMLLTTATADHWIPNPFDRGIPRPGDPEIADVDFLDLYPERTFRFCFSNAQMARATCEFIWSQPDLRPDSDPAYPVHWLDDSYSRDLYAGYLTALQGVTTVQQALFIDSSVGTFSLPNRFEQTVSQDLLSDLTDHPAQKRPLVAVTGQALPCRRFLRAIVRSDPVRGRQLVVTTGDGVSFTNLYRDRLTHWPIQDLPFPLVAFAHANPIDETAGFRAEEGTDSGEEAGIRQTSQTGTDDLLLLEDVLMALTLAYNDETPASDATQLAQRLRRIHYAEGHVGRPGSGIPFFDPRGSRANGTGEHLVCLRPRLPGEVALGSVAGAAADLVRLTPRVQSERVLPAATLDVYRWTGPTAWQTVGKRLTVLYDMPPGAGSN